MLFSQVFFHTLNEIALQLFFGGVFLVCFQTFFADTFLAKRTVFPADFRTFVTSDMDIFAGEKRGDFIEYALHELERFFFSGTHDDVFHTPDNTRSGRLALARKFGIGGDGSQFMSRKFDFRHDRDKTVGGILNDFLDLVLCIETSVFGTFTVDTFGADFRQLRVFLDLDTPALVVCQVPVHTVDLEQS